MILAIDTATQYASLALYDGDGIFAEETWFSGRRHTTELTPRIHRMLDLAEMTVSELTALAVAIGPGSFTGLRIGLAVAKGLALPKKLPVIGVPTLEIAAYPFRNARLPVWAVAEAGRKRILVSCYLTIEERWQPLDEPMLTTFEGLVEEITEPAICTGEINAEMAQMLEKATEGRAQVVAPSMRSRRAGYLAEIAVARLEASYQDDPDALVPIYVSSP